MHGQCNARPTVTFPAARYHCPASSSSSSGVAGLSAVYSTCTHPQPALAQCATPLSLGLVLYILRAQLSLRVSLARCHGAALSYRLTPPICHPCRQLSSQPRRLQSGCDGLSHFIEDTGGPSVPVQEFNLAACRKPDINSTCRN